MNRGGQHTGRSVVSPPPPIDTVAQENPGEKEHAVKGELVQTCEKLPNTMGLVVSARTRKRTGLMIGQVLIQ